ncbi:MAG: hypothetical protein M3Y06_07625 [Actinomycetota bacterium]|nr:hypothetical protein [Actinomycetota bacterium]
MRRLVLAFAAAALVLGACSADRTDFKRETESFLKKGVAAEAIGVAFTKAECEAPASTKVGTKYYCVANGADGSTWDIEATITSKTLFTITDRKVRT